MKTLKDEFDSAIKPPASDSMAAHKQYWAYEGKVHEHKSVIGFSKRTISSYGLVSWGGMGRVKEQKRLVVKACITNGCSGFLDEHFACGLCDVKVLQGVS